MIEEGTVTASRPRHRAARAAVVSALLLPVSASTLAACSAGQVTQTSTQTSVVPGINADVGRAPNGGPVVALRNVMFVYSDPAGFPVGGNAPMIVRLFNETALPLKLTGVEAAEFGKVVLSGGPGEAVGASQEPSPGASEAPSAPAGDATIAVEIPAHGYTELVPGEGPFLQITALTQKIAPGHLVPVTFTFSNGSSAELMVSSAPPSVPAERSPLPIGEAPE
jgi:hypothetical protein